MVSFSDELFAKVTITDCALSKKITYATEMSDIKK